MSNELRFDGRVAVVTGAGRGLGRAHAMLLASRGAKVVANDVGSDRSASGAGRKRAEETAAEITAQGGEAVAHIGDVASQADTETLVEVAVERFGRLDIVVNNAGITGFRALGELTSQEFDRFYRVHVLGTFLTTRAAWPQMVKQGYGRVVMTSSIGMFGPEQAAHYAAAKGGVFGLMRAASVEGRRFGITANGILPAAVTPVVEELSVRDTELLSEKFDSSPDMVAPVVAWLVHEDCGTTGELFHVGFGWVGRVLTGQGPGYADRHLSVESIRDHWADIRRDTPYTDIPTTDAGLKALMEAAPTKTGR